MNQRREQERLKRVNKLTAAKVSAQHASTSTSQILGGVEDHRQLKSPQSSSTESPIQSPGEKVQIRIDDSSLRNDSMQTEDTMSSWTSTTISEILQVSLDSSAERLFYLSQLHDELKSEAAQLELSLDNLERVIFSRISNQMEEPPFDYLLSSYKRAEDLFRLTRRNMHASQKLEALTEMKRLCVNYAGLSVTMPELLETMHTPPDIVARLLYADEESKIPDSFLGDLVTKFVEEDTMSDFFEPILLGLSRSMNGLTFTEDFFKHFGALRQLLEQPEIIKVLYKSEHFIPNCSPPELENLSLLGPFFRLSPIDTKVANQTFAVVIDGNPQQTAKHISSLRTTIPVLQAQLFNLCNMIVRHSAQSRQALLELFAKIVNVNKKRHALQVEAATVSSDGFMLNITAVLNRFADPFLADMTKISRIDISYLRRQPLIDLHDETKLMADEQTSAQHYAKSLAGENNFISHIFFLNVAYHHYGLGATMATHQKIMEKIRDMQRYKDRMSNEQPFTGPQAMMMTMQYKRIENALTQLNAMSHCYETILCDETSQARSFSFLSLVASWLIRLVDREHQYPQSMISLPLVNLDEADAYKNLPEYFVEDIAEFFLYISRMIPGLLVVAPVTDLVVFSLVFLRSSSYIKNPYLKAKLVEILFNGTRPFRRGETRGALSDALNSHTLALHHLFPALMGFYIEVESTGLSSQFYDKFNIRFHISQIFKSIWENPAHRVKLAREAEHDIDFFVRFVALLLNDQTYLLDEALAKLQEIHDIQIELRTSSDTASEQHSEKLSHLQQSERQATSYLQLGTETLSMLNLFTASIPAAFCTPEIADRLAAMLDYNVDALVGPKCTGLKVENPEKYHFDPKSLLSGIVGIFLNMSKYDDFVLAVVRDGRSYKKDNFDRTAQILTKFSLRSPQDIAILLRFVEQVERKKVEYQQDEDDLGDIPDEFLDPLIGELMRDPVVLPTSKTIIDRGTIKRHLLNDATDPFNRAPLALKDVVPADVLRRQIEDFVAAKKKERATSFDV